MFETSYFDRLQDYLASGCTMELTDDEMDYYNALYALIGIQRKYVLNTNNDLLQSILEKDLIVDSRAVRDGIKKLERMERNVSRG